MEAKDHTDQPEDASRLAGAASGKNKPGEKVSKPSDDRSLDAESAGRGGDETDGGSPGDRSKPAPAGNESKAEPATAIQPAVNADSSAEPTCADKDDGKAAREPAVRPEPATGDEPGLTEKEHDDDGMPGKPDIREAQFNHPKALSDPIAAIERALEQNNDAAEPVRQLCQRAMTSPDALVDAASTFLAHTLTPGLLQLCDVVPSAYLAEEVAQGGAVVAPVAFSHWKETGNVNQLVRLADALVDQAPRLKTADTGELLLQLAVEIAIQKPLRSMRLIEIARPLVGPPAQSQPLREARRWQAAGDFIREGGGTCRAFWARSLRTTEAIDWKSGEASSAIDQLVRAWEKGADVPGVLVESLPAPLREKLFGRSADTEQTSDAAPTSEPEAAPSPDTTAAPPTASRPQSRPRMGILVGTVVLAVAAGWFARDSILPLLSSPHPASGGSSAAVPPSAAPPLDGAPVVPSAPAPDTKAQISAPSPASSAPPSAAPSAQAEPKAGPADTPAPAISDAAPLPPPMRVDDSPPVKVAAPPPGPAPAHSEIAAATQDAWRKLQLADLVKEHPAVSRWHQATKKSTWRESHSMLMGLRSFLPYDGDDFAHLLTMLLLDPPVDPDVAEAVPKIAARRLKTDEFVPLWEKLVYPGSPNEKQIRAAAEAYLSVKADYLSLQTLERLKKIAQPPAAGAHE